MTIEIVVRPHRICRGQSGHWLLLCTTFNYEKSAYSEVAYFLGYHYTPYATEQGIISEEQGILAQEQRILLALLWQITHAATHRPSIFGNAGNAAGAVAR